MIHIRRIPKIVCVGTYHFSKNSPPIHKRSPRNGSFSIVDPHRPLVDFINHASIHYNRVALSVKKTWSIKLFPHEKERINKIIQTKMDLSDPPLSKREVFLNTFSTLDESPEVIPPGESSARDLEGSCELNFLQRIVDPKDGIAKWFCLRGSRPDRKAKPILLGDGKDGESIFKLCQACRDGWLWSQQRSLSDDKIQAIKSFGESEIEAHLFICNHPDSHYVQITPDPKSDFLCLKTNNRQSIKKKCILESCDYLIHQILKVVIKDTPQYEELQKQLEEKK